MKLEQKVSSYSVIHFPLIQKLLFSPGTLQVFKHSTALISTLKIFKETKHSSINTLLIRRQEHGLNS